MVFVVVGMPASGKNIARLYAEERLIPYFATGDIVRREIAKRGLNASAENTSIVSTEMRGEDGMGVTRMALSAALACESPIVFVEGMRSWPEIELIRSETGCLVIAFVTPRQTRRDRMKSRARADDLPSAFDERDLREIAYGTAVPVALADAYILNTGTMDEALADLDALVKTSTPEPLRATSVK
ncbi:MAG TPA: AAA family ATPase [Syntrophorhabdaceae bacterium]|nr:AAA family ATPase [Syntrophorhabdaceae bacterium]